MSNPLGRPRKQITDEQRDRLTSYLALSTSQRTIASLLGISLWIIGRMVSDPDVQREAAAKRDLVNRILGGDA